MLPKFTPDTRFIKPLENLEKKSDSGVVPKNMHRLTTDRKVSRVERLTQVVV